MGAKPLSGLPDHSGQDLGFDTVPAGDWDLGNLVVGTDGKFVLASTEKRQLPDITTRWHASQVDLLELGDPIVGREDYELQLRNYIRSAPYAGNTGLGAATVVAIWNIDPVGDAPYNEDLSQESRIYSFIQHTSIAPRFLAHVTENHDRVIGYVLELVPARTAGIEDLDLCRKVLQELHGLNILHGNLTRDAFLIRQDIPLAQLRWFQVSRESADQKSLDEEASKLEEVLQKPLFKPKEGKPSAELTAIMARDGYVHPVLFRLLEKEGRINLSQDAHRSLLAELEERGWHFTAEYVDDVYKTLCGNGGHLA